METINPLPSLNLKFNWWCQKVLPLVYDESLSYYEVLCKLTEYLKEMTNQVNSITDLANQLNTTVAEVTATWPTLHQQILNDQAEFQTTVNAELAEMSQTLDDIKSGKYVDLYLNSIQNYIDQNLAQIVAQSVNFVTFGINNMGYFVAYIPANWKFLKFGTINNPDSALYGHLTLEVGNAF